MLFDSFLHQLATVLRQRHRENIFMFAGVCFLEKLNIPGPDEMDSLQRLDTLLHSVLGDQQQYRSDSVIIEREEPGPFDEGQPRYLIQLLPDV